TGAATPTVTAGPTVAPTAVLVAPPPAPANTPSAWSLTVNDLPAGFTIETADASEDADGTYYTALFNRRGTSTERGPYGVFNQLALLKFPSGIRLGQEFVDRIGDELEFTTTYELGASTITSDIRTSASTR